MPKKAYSLKESKHYNVTSWRGLKHAQESILTGIIFDFQWQEGKNLIQAPYFITFAFIYFSVPLDRVCHVTYCTRIQKQLSGMSIIAPSLMASAPRSLSLLPLDIVTISSVWEVTRVFYGFVHAKTNDIYSYMHTSAAVNRIRAG